ncbi:MAG: DUF1150 domain-containing protein [Rhodospirillales bacterium]|nr:DUF1150 domain-containing protein [Rhodospirillales bacterium]MDH3911174.1 DUF1150 domain-containing protein [Rhodospirillales bacterium]MDH3919871.1 DUF1150 domain-containing protein [Rhodospirillales bacterium]MDH3967137.1 DUF1150 domain-containing protein [Rhodospirillales bacterium]
MTYAESIRQISQQDLMALGVSDLAYVKPIEIEGQRLFAVYTADGTQVTVLPTREVAIATILRHDLEPVSIQ